MGVPIEIVNGARRLMGMSSIGSRVRALRKGKDLTQVQLAQLLGLDQSTLSDIENNKNDAFAGRVLLRMSEVFDVSPFFILYGHDAASQARALEEAELLRAFRTADPAARESIMRVATALAAQAQDKPLSQ